MDEAAQHSAARGDRAVPVQILGATTFADPIQWRCRRAGECTGGRNAAGWANTTLNPVDSFSITHAFLFAHDQTTDLGTLGGSWSRAYAINNQDVIAGAFQSETGERAFVARGQSFTPLDPLAGDAFSRAVDINDDGIIVGISSPDK